MKSKNTVNGAFGEKRSIGVPRFQIPILFINYDHRHSNAQLAQEGCRGSTEAPAKASDSTT